MGIEPAAVERTRRSSIGYDTRKTREETPMSTVDRPAAVLPAMLAVWTDIDPTLEADFNEW